MKINSNKKINLLVIFFLILYSFLINYYFGFQGFNFVDSFQHIAGGEKIVAGEVPFKDYWISDSGPLMDFVQGILFNIFGKSWNVLVLNSSLINIIFTLTIFWLCSILELSLIPKIIFPVLSATVMYPASGTPLIDFHSLIISVFGLTYFIFLIKNSDFKKMIIIPMIFIIAFFFKQVPSAYFAIIILFISIYYFFKQKREILYSQFFGSVIGLIITFLILYFLNIEIEKVYEQFFLMPISQLTERGIDQTIDTSFFSTSQKIRYVVFLLIPSIVVLYNLLKSKKKISDVSIINLIIIFGLFTTGILHESYTLNQSTTLGILPLISIFLLTFSNIKDRKLEFILYAINLVIILRLIKLDINYVILFIILIFAFIYFKNKFFVYNKFRILLISYTILTTIFYFDKLIINRKWQDIYNPNWKQDSIDASKIDYKLKGLRWISNDPDTKKEFFVVGENLKYLKNSASEGNYILITHYQIYNMVLNQNNFSPVKYWWKNASFPLDNKILKNKFDKTFLEKIEKNKVKRIIVLKDVKIYEKFNIKYFQWLIECSILDKKNSNSFREVYKIVSKCKI